MLREQAKFFWDDAWGPNPHGSGPTSISQASAATGVSTAAQADTLANFSTAPQAGTPANIPAAPQAVTLSSSVTAASQADGTHVVSSDADSAEAAALLSLNHSHASDSLPFSAPTADSDGGQGGGFDIVAGDFSTDWFVA
jgi:hypothetical protein